MELVHEMTYHAMLKPPMPVGDGPFGNRMFFEVTGGEVKGDRIRGTFVGGGGDWILVGPDGIGRLDVRVKPLDRASTLNNSPISAGDSRRCA